MQGTLMGKRRARTEAPGGRAVQQEEWLVSFPAGAVGMGDIGEGIPS